MLVPDPLHPEKIAHPERVQGIVILGSTGSIGRSTLSLLRNNPEKFELIGLVAHSSAELLAEQIQEFQPQYAGLSSKSAAHKCKQLLKDLPQKSRTEVLAGDDAISQLVATDSVDTVVAGIVGMAGLRSVVSAIEHGKTIALANKESLIVAGELITKLVAANPSSRVIPVDSEHSAIFQALQGERVEDIHTVTLTASGGPFLTTNIKHFAEITPDQAVKHPRWSMGPKISVDSATLMNKALEVIEAHWLFGVSEKDIRVVVHPQSIVHSLVDFVDGSSIAQLSVPDMRGAIAYALSFGRGRLPGAVQALDLASIGSLDFHELDSAKFPSVNLALSAIDAGGTAALTLNVANEIAVAAFLNGDIRFDQIFRFTLNVMESADQRNLSDLRSLLEFEEELRQKLTSDLQHLT